jgi:hypothetical protein
MMMIQPYSADYQDQVVNLILTIQRDEFLIPIKLTDQPDLLKIPTVYQQRKGNFWIAIDGNQVIGTIALYEKNSFIEVQKTQLPPQFPIMAVDSKFYHLNL